MTVLAEKKLVEVRSIVRIESHQCYIHKYSQLYEAAIKSGAPIAEIDLLCYVRERLAARNGTGLAVVITFAEFRTKMSMLKPVYHEQWIEFTMACEAAWCSFAWPHANITTPPSEDE